MKENCIFCKIIEGNIPSSKVYEDDDFLAFLDIHPVSEGHTLLIPKEHIIWMHEASNKLISELFIKTKELMNKMIKELPCDYVQIEVVGKDVPHLHIHLIPRHLDDEIKQPPTHLYKSKEKEEEIKNKLFESFNSN
ncbi:MAG: HIT family protein [Patescibacteria group bacterium]|nr:HIT family protein [Patescibacteria group bacterium]